MKEQDVEQEQTVEDYQTIEVSTQGRVGVIQLNRPKALNALNGQLCREVIRAAADFEADQGIGAIVLTGSEKAFAAGADIKEMADKDFAQVYAEDLFGLWESFAAIRLPVVAAVAGHALGGGCELAMMCDIVLAADNARFGQPEINLGLIPGMGGTQRLTRAVGKSKAMDMVLTGRIMQAEEAERCGLVSRVVPVAELMDAALELAGSIAEKSRPVAMLAVETVNAAYESSLAEGLRLERRLNHACFALQDRREGMAAFVEKRQAEFKHR